MSEENNNSLISIEENGLPEKSGLFWIIEDGELLNEPVKFCHIKKEWFLYASQYPTHYAPVKKPPLPIKK
jgi:hypothetical protein